MYQYCSPSSNLIMLGEFTFMNKSLISAKNFKNCRNSQDSFGLFSRICGHDIAGDALLASPWGRE
uniref:Uncharacterized protein n=1 Tax=Parascaris equorum TaxID=6256 RepID=A0A914S0K6_PAREQ